MEVLHAEGVFCWCGKCRCSCDAHAAFYMPPLEVARKVSFAV